MICGVCINQDLSYDSSFSPLLYEEATATLVNRLKHHRDITILACLSTIFCNAFYHAKQNRPELIVSIPLSRNRYFLRGFNQSHELAQLISKELRIPHLPILKRTRNTKPQQGLSRRARLKNLQNCFNLTKSVDRQAIEGKSIALVDDVVTTGATMELAAKELKKVGAKCVFAWSIARTDYK